MDILQYVSISDAGLATAIDGQSTGRGGAVFATPVYKS